MRYVSVHRQMVEVGRSWLFAARGKNPRRSGPWMEWITHSLALLSWVEETVAFTGAGRRRQRLVARRVLLLPRPLASGISNGRLPEYGIRMAISGSSSGDPKGEAQVHCLTAGRSECVGFTAARVGDKKKNCTKLSGPIPKFWEHVLETRELRKGRHNSQRRKVQAFARYPEHEWACFVVRQGPARQVGALEAKLIAELQPNGNTRFRGCPGPVSLELGEAIQCRVARQLAQEAARLVARERLKATEHGFQRVYSHLLNVHVASFGYGHIPLTSELRVGAAVDLRPEVDIGSPPWSEPQA